MCWLPVIEDFIAVLDWMVYCCNGMGQGKNAEDCTRPKLQGARRGFPSVSVYDFSLGARCGFKDIHLLHGSRLCFLSINICRRRLLSLAEFAILRVRHIFGDLLNRASWYLHEEVKCGVLSCSLTCGRRAVSDDVPWSGSRKFELVHPRPLMFLIIRRCINKFP